MWPVGEIEKSDYGYWPFVFVAVEDYSEHFDPSRFRHNGKKTDVFVFPQTLVSYIVEGRLSI